MAERRKGQREADAFRKLPERAQEIWFHFCDISIKSKKVENLSFINYFGADYSSCKSPIEVIFNFAFDLVCFYEGYMEFNLFPQYEVMDGKKKYYADFAFFASEIEDIMCVDNPSFKLVIECDGHDFHEKTKEQVTKDNEREYSLKMKGYDVLRFSGSQIFNKPFRCAAQTLDYILEKITEGEEG